MNTKRKFYDFYKECMKSGQIPYCTTEDTDGGLCSIFPKEMQIFKPTPQDVFEHHLQFGGEVYWASDLYQNSDEAATDFSTTRQTIVLLLAAMNNEL